ERRGLRARRAARRAPAVQPDAGVRGGSHRAPPHGERGLRPAWRARLLAAHGARRRREDAGAAFDASEPRGARAAHRGVDGRGPASLRECAARGGGAATDVLTPLEKIFSRASPRAYTSAAGLREFSACNRLRGGVQELLSQRHIVFLTHARDDGLDAVATP